MEIQLKAEQITALRNQLDPSVPPFDFDGENLIVPDDHAAAVNAITSKAGWDNFMLPRSVQGAILVHALDKATKVTPRDLAYVAGLTSAREDMASITRIAGVDGSTAKAWFDAALGVTA